MTTRCFALIPAAGTGTRIGHALPKQYLPVAGVPMLTRTMRVLAAVRAIERIAVVVAPDDHRCAVVCRDEALGDRVDVLRVGGASRAESVANGLERLGDRIADDDWVLVHDAARCGIDVASVERLIARVRDDETGGLLAVPLDDTIKRQCDFGAGVPPAVAETVDRRGLWRAQTPQMFRAAVLRDALADARERGLAVTDEAGAVEATGRRVLLVPGSPANFKVTTAADLAMMSRLLDGTST